MSYFRIFLLIYSIISQKRIFCNRMEEKVCFSVSRFHFTTFQVINQSFKIRIHHFRSNIYKNQHTISPLFYFKCFRQHYRKQKNNKRKKMKQRKMTQKNGFQNARFYSYLLRFLIQKYAKSGLKNRKNVSPNCG